MLFDPEGLPANWLAIPIHEICSFNPKHSKEFDDDLEIAFVPMAAVDAMSGTIAEQDVRRLGKVRKGYTHFADGDVIFAKITPCMENGKSAVAIHLTSGIGCGSTEFHVLRSNGTVIPEYLHRFLRQESYRNYAAQNMTGVVGQRRVPKQFLLESPGGVPPLNEQRRIVTKIEALTAHSRRARKALDDVSKLIAQFRQSVLTAAFRGDFTADWRKQNPDVESAEKLLERIRAERAKNTQNTRDKNRLIKDWHELEVSNDSTLPNSWLRCSIGHAGNVCNGSTPSRKKNSYWNGSIPWISSGEVHNNIIASAKEKITEQGFRNSSVRILPVGSVFIAMIGVGKTRGQTAILELQATINQNIAAVILDHGLVSSKYLWHWFRYQYSETRRVGSGSGPQALNCQRVREMPFFLPPFPEQNVIAKQIDSLLELAEKIEGQYQNTKEDLDELNQSILAKAFRGELVSQDPNDEPASVLLDRIRAEREKLGTAQKKRRTSRKQTKQTSSEQLSL